MTLEDLKVKIKQIEQESTEKKRQAYIDYAKANNPYKVGDIVTDHVGPIKIDKIGISIAWGEPHCTYTGIELKKDLTPVKRETIRTVHQTNIKATE